MVNQESVITSEWLNRNMGKIVEAHPAFFAADTQDFDILRLFKDRAEFRDFIRKLDDITSGRTFIGHTLEILPAPDAEDDIYESEDPSLSWCLENPELFRDHDPSFVAVDPKKGRIVLSDPDEDVFRRKFDAFGDDEKRTLFVIHTSIIVG